MNNQTLVATAILAIAAGIVLFLVLTVLQTGSGDVGINKTSDILQLGDGDYTEMEFRELLRGYFVEPDFAAFWCEGRLGDLSLPAIADSFGLLVADEYQEDAERARAIIGEECRRVGR